MSENIKVHQGTILPSDKNKRIFTLRNCQVMFDYDLSEIYGVETKILKKAVRRNISRFPADFMFEPTVEELEILRYPIGTSTPENLSEADLGLNLSFQFGTERATHYTPEQQTGRGGTRYLPFAFTEPGIAMLSTVLQSERAIQINIGIMRTFILLRAKSNMNSIEMWPKLESIHNELKELQQKFVRAETKPQALKSLPETQTLDRVTFIQSLVARRWGIGIDDLISTTRTKTVTLARHIAIFLIRSYLGLGLHEIGQRFGNRDHTTILHAYNKIRAESEDRISIQKEIESFRNDIEPMFT